MYMHSCECVCVYAIMPVCVHMRVMCPHIYVPQTCAKVREQFARICPKLDVVSSARSRAQWYQSVQGTY